MTGKAEPGPYDHGYWKSHKAQYQCSNWSCEHRWMEAVDPDKKKFGTVCPKCGNHYMEWLNFEKSRKGWKEREQETRDRFKPASPKDNVKETDQ